MKRHTGWRVSAAIGATVALLAGCAAPSENGATGESSDQIVLAEGYELGGYNPVNGYSETGVSPFYDGLYRPSADTDTVDPELDPSLAGGEPEPAGPNRWRIPLRTGVVFSDDSTFDSADVVATYAAVANPEVASEISTSVAPIETIAADGPDAVVVELNTAADPKPYLLLGILLSKKVEAKPAADWAVNTALPAGDPFTADVKARPAMNLGVDREAMVRDVLVGYGSPASTPVATESAKRTAPERHSSCCTTRRTRFGATSRWPTPQR